MDEEMAAGALKVIGVLDLELLTANKLVRGIVGKTITIECHYDHGYQSHVKYWCQGWTHQCSVVVTTNDQHGWGGRVSITDKKTAAISYLNVCFFPTESVSVPVLRYLSPPNVSCFGGSVSVSCESVQGSLPIQYKWYEKTPTKGSKISDTNKLDLHCQSFKQQHHQYYCTASNNQGEKSSEMVDVSVFNRAGKRCSYVTQISGIGKCYFERTI
uniref:CMRF35-like molecule 8 n=1 Tax=Pristiophorus japonicus TaxID=55135 RepID=UPI00398F3C90